MNFTDMASLMEFWKEEFENRRELPTQYPNAKEDIDKKGLWCELSTENEVRILNGFRTDEVSGKTMLCYDETGEFVITLYENRGDGTGEIQKMIDCIKEIFTDRYINEIEFFQARELTLVPVEEQHLMQVFAPFETSFEEQQKENIT